MNGHSFNIREVIMSQEPVMGGSFLFSDVREGRIRIREDITAEQQAIGKTCEDFFKNEVLPRSAEIEVQKDGVAVELLKKAGELGLLMVEIPEGYGGLGMDKTTATVVSEYSSIQGSFAVTFMCHTGIGTLPILYYGTPAQKEKYLPKLATGEFVGAYALTEAGSGSDALGAKAKAVLSADGKHYVLNGAKMFITNGRWADVVTVFAKVDGEKFTAFIVETKWKGVSCSAEEKKMGIKGSSTVVLNLDDVQVPVENVLGEIGRGHKIAFNVLNVGRWKLGSATVGANKNILRHMVRYTKERKQFGKNLTEFGLIRKKIADAAMLSFVTESLIYRIAGLYDDAIGCLDKSDKDYDRKCIEAIEEYAIEASIAKVFGSEALWRVADEGVQALGGYGFIAEYPMEAAQRDCRINRLFEGTNEINRLIIPGTLLKRGLSGKFDMMGEIQKILGELKTGYTVSTDDEFRSGPTIDRVNLAKKLAIYSCGVAVQKHMAEIQNQQYLMEKMANLIIETYTIDSAVKRTLQLMEAEGQVGEIVPGSKNSIVIAMCKCYVAESYDRILLEARQLLAEVADGNVEEWKKYKKALARFDVFDPLNTTRQREIIANHMIAAEQYALQ